MINGCAMASTETRLEPASGRVLLVCAVTCWLAAIRKRKSIPAVGENILAEHKIPRRFTSSRSFSLSCAACLSRSSRSCRSRCMVASFRCSSSNFCDSALQASSRWQACRQIQKIGGSDFEAGRKVHLFRSHSHILLCVSQLVSEVSDSLLSLS